MQAWHNLDIQYGILDVELMPDGTEEVSIEDEYATYVLAPVSRGPIDLVGFWEVNYQLLTDHCPASVDHSACSCPNTSTPPFIE